MRKKAIQKKKGKYIEKMTSCIWAAALLSPVILIAYQTAWLKANSEDIDANIDAKLCDVYLRKAIGNLK